MTDNPNTYDDDRFASAATKLDSAVVELWEAGASIQNLEDILANAFANATGEEIDVMLS